MKKNKAYFFIYMVKLCPSFNKSIKILFFDRSKIFYFVHFFYYICQRWKKKETIRNHKLYKVYLESNRFSFILFQKIHKKRRNFNFSNKKEKGMPVSFWFRNKISSRTKTMLKEFSVVVVKCFNSRL